MQKVNTFTRAAFLGSKNLPQNCVIHDKFSAIKSAWFATFQCETPGNSEKYQETVWNRVKQSQTETLLVSSCCHKHLTFIYTTLHNILHQDFYPSWEIFTRTLVAPVAPFCISEKRPIFWAKNVWFCSVTLYLFIVLLYWWDNMLRAWSPLCIELEIFSTVGGFFYLINFPPGGAAVQYWANYCVECVSDIVRKQ